MMFLSRTVQLIPSGITRLSSLIVCMAVAMSLLPQTAEAKVTAAEIFNSHMVLQQEMDVPVWGTADAGEQVAVTFAGQTLKTKADADGKWMVKLKPLKATADQQGQSLTITGSNTITFDDVLIGEVWLCSGQSNMRWVVNQAKDAKAEIANADYPQIRMFTVGADRTVRQPRDTVKGNWELCSPSTAGRFSATAYYFGRKLHKDLNVPIGLITSAVGGTKAESWTSGDAIEKHMPEFAKAYAERVHPGQVLEQKIQEYKDDQKAFVISMAKLVEHEADGKTATQYAAPEFDDSSWQSMAMPGYWIQKGLKDYEGLVWFRKTIDVPTDWAGKDLQLNLGDIHAIDVTWFNGQEIGSTGSAANRNFKMRNTGRVYQVPGKFVKAGKNVVAVRVISSLWRGGGFVGDEKTILKLKPVDGTPAGAGAVSLVGEWRYLPVFQLSNSPVNPEHYNRPSILFNGMINPLIPYAIRGATWYQGESNVNDYELYERLLSTMITDWRTRWNQSDFPFLIVQLPNIRNMDGAPNGDAWTRLREAQARVALTLPDVGLAVTLDIGESKNIHPANKQDVGKRLALIAEAKTYGMKDVVHSGPTLKSIQIKGSEVFISYDNLGGGLVQKGDKLEGFGLQDKDGLWVWADARIQGDQIIVSSKKVPSPVGVNYAWTSNPPSTLYNKAGLPAAQFKSDTK